jgi:amino acid adenylation domain-containing protein
MGFRDWLRVESATRKGVLMKDQLIGAEVPFVARAVPLSGSQRSLWFQYIRHPELKGLFNFSFVIRIEPGIEAARLQPIVAELLRRHAMFRVRLVNLDGEVMQQLQPDASIPLRVVEVDAADQTGIARLINVERHTPFDVTTAPLVRTTLYRAGPRFSVLVVTFDHLVCDGWSGWQVSQQICDMLAAGPDAILAQLGHSLASHSPPDHSPKWLAGPEFFDHVLEQQQWLASTQARKQLAYWRQELAHPVAPLELAYERNQPERREVSVIALDARLVGRLRELASRHEVSLYVVLLASYLMLLQRLTGQRQLAIGAPMPGRSKEWHATIGFFTNPVVLRAEVTPGMCVAELLKQVRSTLWRALKNQSYPYPELVQQLRPQREHPDHPFFQVWFNHQNARIESDLVTLLTPIDAAAQVRCGDLVLRPFGEWYGSGGPGLDLLLETVEVGTQVRADLNYNAGRFERATIERYLGYWQCLLEAMVSSAAAPIERLPLLSEAERRQLLLEWNTAERDCPQVPSQSLCVHTVFEQQVRRTPAAIAVDCAGEQLRYDELNARANQLARRLRTAGVGSGDPVAVLLERSIQLLVAKLAVLKCGAAYLPLDVHAPVQRQRFFVSDSGAKCVLSASGMAQLEPLGAACVDVDDPSLRTEDCSDLGIAVDAAASAYIMYTSGSTGVPKGVAVPHRGVVRLVVDNNYMELHAQDRIGFAASPAFDAATFEVWAALLNGARLVVVTQRVLLDPQALAVELQRSGINLLFLTTGLFNQLAAAQPTLFAGLKYLMIGGDVADPKRIATVLSSGAPAHFLIFYGPTEATVFVTTYQVAAIAPDTNILPIGRPIANSCVYILDEQGEPVPAGVRGEIYIGGEQVALGYLNQPALTRERFVSDPFAVGGSQRMFRTGDLGRWRADGTIEFLGRNDAQVKIRGFRIELGEIEARLSELAGVVDAVVVARSQPGAEKRLVAYYVGAQLSAEALRAQLGQSLPDYMVPAAYVRLAELPLKENGKLDRAALPAPNVDAYPQSHYEAPRGAVEEILAQLWQELLQVARVGRHDHFFELGGHSLLAVKLIDQLRQHGWHLHVAALFMHPTLMALAQTLRSSRQTQIPDDLIPDNLIPCGCTSITPQMLPLIALSQEEIDSIVATVDGGAGNVQDIYPLTAPQEGILFHHMLRQQADAYVLPNLLRFDSRARLDGFVAALRAGVARHDILRTAVLWQGLSQPVQVVWRRTALDVVELEMDPLAGSAADQLRTRFAPRYLRLDVTRAPMLQVFMAHDRIEQCWLLVVVSHHLVQDNVTIQGLLEEMRIQITGAGELPPAVPFRNAIAQLRRSADAEAQAAFFREMLGAIDEPTLPFGLQAVGRDSDELQRSRTWLAASLSQRLRGQARALGVSVASLFHVAWARLVACAADREQVVFGTVLFGRMQAGAGASRAGGMFTNTLPIRIAVDQGTVRERVIDTHRCLARLLQYDDASLVLAQRCSGVPAATPLFSSLLNYRHGTAAGLTPLQWPGVELLDVEEGSHYPLRLSIDDADEGLALSVYAPATIGAQRICELIATILDNLATALEHAPQTPINRIDVLSAVERQQVVYDWNAGGCNDRGQRCIHQLFESRAASTPNAVALELDAEQLNYAELNRRANALAHYLRTLGVGPEVRVALCVERSFATVVTILAVLKAGGAYVPLDPGNPMERLQWMLQDSQPRVLLVDAAGRAVLPQLDAALTVIDVNDDHRWADQPHHDPDPHGVGLQPQHLAYVIYTSGSTGKPKGVMIEHAHVTRLFSATRAWFGFDASDTWSLFHSYAFDFSVWELWGALTHGGRLVIVPLDVARSPQKFHRLLCRTGISVLNQTPSAFRQFLAAQSGNPRRHRLRYVIFGGEALDTTMLRPWYEQHHNRATQLINMYGITEITVHATYKVLSAADAVAGSACIGRRIPDLQLYILDAQGQPVPVGVTGEICISGAGVARGYLNRDQLTTQRFLANDFSTRPGERLYRTGDLGRWRADGEIDYLGRNDAQVKIRGFRIELGEIEAQLRSLSEVDEAVVVARREADGEQRLVAYYTRAAAAVIDAQRLKQQLGTRLPAYMVPEALVELGQLPLTSNGKLDREALPVPQREALSTQDYERPQGELEHVVAEIWKDVLHVQQVSRHDDFFDLGGNSLLAMRLSARIRQAVGREPKLDTWLMNPTLAALAAQLDEARAVDGCELQAIVPDREHEHEPFALTPLQLAYWVGRNAGFELGNVGAHVYLEMPVEEVDVERFQRALNRLIARHGMLRMVITAQGKQRILPNVPWYAVHVNDWRAASGVEAQQRLNEVRLEMSHQVFSGRQWPLFDFRISRLAARAVIHTSIDALMLDGSSALILRAEFMALYADPTRELVPLELSFRDYVLARQRLEQGELHQRARHYWLSRVPDFPAAPDLPLACDPAQIVAPRFERRSHRLEPRHWQALLAGAQHYQVTPTALFLSCFGEVLSRWTTQARFALNLTLFNRLPLHPQVDQVLGDFSTLTLLAMDFGLETSFADRLRATQQQLWSDLEHHYFDGVEMLQALRQVRDQPVRYPLVVTSTLGLPRHAVDAAGEAAAALRVVGEEYSITQTSQVWLDVQVFEQAGGIAYNWDSVVGLFPEGMLDAMFAALGSLFEHLADAASSWEEALQVEPPARELELIAEANASTRNVPRGLLHAAVLQQIAARPSEVAVRTAEKLLSYGELGRRSAALAAQLAQGGARRNQPIAIVMEKGWQQIVAVLGILQAGAAYLPIDASWPRARIEQLLESVAVEQVVTTAERASWVPPRYTRYAIADELPPGDSGYVPAIAEPEDLAYVIFTSGSTGVPKGVMIEHAAALNTVLDINERWQVGAQDCVFGLSNLSFDLSVYDIFGVLGAGGTLVLPSAAEYLDPGTWLRYLHGDDASGPVTLWNTVPALLQMLMDWLEGSGHQLDLRVVLLSGDWIAVDLPQRVRSLAPDAQVISLGGATEVSIWSIAYPIAAVSSEWRSIPYGKALTNQQFYVLRSDLSPAPLWVPGDLYIGGVGLARGYWGDAEKTASSFIHHPRTGQRLYKTGDHGRLLPDGNIEFLGRQDQQVKIQGYRIELGEIEARLKSHPSIRDAIVLVHRSDRASRLTAYVVGRAVSAEIDLTESLLEYLRLTLPDYMVPQQIIPIPSIPLTANGKLDRQALPVPELRERVSTYEAPQGEIEAALAQVWRELLPVDRIGRDDNFFQLGGDSLLAVKSVTRMRQVLGVEVPVRALFTSPTISALAAQVQELLPCMVEDESYERGVI